MKCGEITLKMMISDPPLVFDIRQIGQKVIFNQHKQDSMDGFIKTNEECLSILPPVYKLIPASSPSTQADSEQENKPHLHGKHPNLKHQNSID